MNIGKIYRLTSDAKESIIKKRIHPHEQGYFVYYPEYFNEIIDTKKGTWKVFPLDSSIVILKVFKTYSGNKKMRGKNSRRVIALLEDSSIGTIYLSTLEWEQIET